MPDDKGMNKYGVELDEGKVKEADKNPRPQGSNPVCPWCGEDLDDNKACPNHGTKPFESDGGA